MSLHHPYANIFTLISPIPIPPTRFSSSPSSRSDISLLNNISHSGHPWLYPPSCRNSFHISPYFCHTSRFSINKFPLYPTFQFSLYSSPLHYFVQILFYPPYRIQLVDQRIVATSLSLFFLLSTHKKLNLFFYFNTIYSHGQNY